MWRIGLLGAFVILLLSGCSARSLNPNVSTDDPEPKPSLIPARNAALQGDLPVEVWTVGTAITKPFEFHQPGSDTLQGLDVDLMTEIAHRNGVQLQWVEMPFAALIPALEEGKIDLAIAAMYITPERAERVNFANPYLETGLVMVVRPELEARIHQETDLAGLKVGVKVGATGDALAQKLQQQGIALEIIHYKESLDSLLDLEIGRLDVVFNDYLNTMAYLADGRSSLKVVHQASGEVAFLSRGQLGIAVCKDDPVILAQVNQSLQEIQQEAIFRSLVKRWLGLELSDG